MSDERPGFLTADAAMLIFGGKGGVGKTTLAAASAIELALRFPTERVLLVSTDPAHSVRDALADATLPANLEVCEIDAAAEHERFMGEHGASLQQIGERGTFLTAEEISEFLSLSVPGVDELMSFVGLARWIEEDRADRYVVDTAPTGHALRLLQMPSVLEGWLEAVEAFLGKHRYMASVFGSTAEDPVEAFIERLTESFDAVSGAWTDAEVTRFVPVMNAEPMSLAETARLLESLDELGVSAPEIVVNRWAPADGSGTVADLARSQREAMAAAGAEVLARSLWVVPLLGGEPRGDGLSLVAGALRPYETESAPDAAPLGPPATRGSVELPTGGERPIVLFAGKGGVGKTTMACATALALARRGRRTMLVSTDPAGSLGDALGLEIGPDPTGVSVGLEAAQLDAEREFAALRDEYVDELEAFMDQLLGGADLTFDREAMERLLDLAPTGIDEVMALVRVTELLEERSCDALVLDTAPSGHLLRLLELPELIERWLSAIFRVLVTYEDVFSLPRVNERLLRLSRGVRALRALLIDGDACRVIGVTIPTALASAETERLIAGCERLGVRVGGLIVNRATPAGGAGLDSELFAREAPEIERVRAAAAGRPVCVVEHGDAPCGASALGDLGERILAREGAMHAAA